MKTFTFTCVDCKKKMEYNSPDSCVNIGEAAQAMGAMYILINSPDCLTFWACKKCGERINHLADWLASLIGNGSMKLSSICSKEVRKQLESIDAS
jgi:hypothetical protein